ncbi:MAG: tRNA-dihydrouridine synthase family protein [Anaerolineae bacterium]|nr:tRNA-dihydrouridine synthase family protein [Anaerolineae bacterium]
MQDFNPFSIGPIKVESAAMLAPMDGYSDLPFRVLTRRLGSAMSITEFINAIDVVVGHPPHHDERLAYLEEERPLVYQVFDDEPARILQAALILEKHKPDIIDVNMGCPARTVANRGAGSGLLKNPQKIAEIFDLLTKSLSVPVTGKIRLGWDENSLNYLETARIIEEHGAAMLTVHGRHRKQGYQGNANWDAIAEIKQQLHIPVIGNGDVKRAEDIQKMINYTGCDAVMIGRAARFNPWIFSFLNREEVSQENVYETIQSQLKLNIGFYGEKRGMILFRKFIKGYLTPYAVHAETMYTLLTVEDVSRFNQLLNNIFTRKLAIIQENEEKF